MIKLDFDKIIEILDKQESLDALRENNFNYLFGKILDPIPEMRPQILQFIEKTLNVPILDKISVCPECMFRNIDYLPPKLVINSDLEEVGADSFYDSNIELITFNGNVKDVDDEAFANCPKLRQVKLQNSTFKKLGYHAFYGCPALKAVVLPETLESLDLRDFEKSPNAMVGLPKSLYGKVFFLYSSTAQEEDEDSEESLWYKNHIVFI